MTLLPATVSSSCPLPTHVHYVDSAPSCFSQLVLPFYHMHCCFHQPKRYCSAWSTKPHLSPTSHYAIYMSYLTRYLLLLLVGLIGPFPVWAPSPSCACYGAPCRAPYIATYGYSLTTHTILLKTRAVSLHSSPVRYYILLSVDRSLIRFVTVSVLLRSTCDLMLCIGSSFTRYTVQLRKVDPLVLPQLHLPTPCYHSDVQF